jgi:predicted RNA binding protein YcfA (HicA-like mRNA interferase family)
VNSRRLLARLASGKFNNVAFRDATALIEAFGFRLSRVQGSHHIYEHPAIDELVNVQDVKGEAKPYQLRQFLRLVERYDLRLEENA